MDSSRGKTGLFGESIFDESIFDESDEPIFGESIFGDVNVAREAASDASIDESKLNWAREASE